MNQAARMSSLGLAEARSVGVCRQAWSPNRRDCAPGGAGGGRGSGGPRRDSGVRVGVSDGCSQWRAEPPIARPTSGLCTNTKLGAAIRRTYCAKDASGSARPRRRFGDQGRAAVASACPPRSLIVSGRSFRCTVHLIACAWLGCYTTRQMPDRSERDALMTCTSAAHTASLTPDRTTNANT